MTKMPPPEQWVLCKLDEMEAAEMIEQHIDFYKEDENGNRRSVHLPMSFVRHYMRRHDSVLPTAYAVATLPLVLADGGLLATTGFDRLRGIQFLIQPELRAMVPSPEDCTPEAVKEAMEFLCDEWLVDVATDGVGKAVLIAAALTLIERTLMDERPCFFVTAGKRGTGKTTLLTMLIKGVIGVMPAASAWSSDENERRKALLALLIRGVMYVLWDNIPRGTQISCPHIERACTASWYSDRVLGVSENATAAATAINLFTGNATGPKGDLASRSLTIHLVADRADPENRPFQHPDPIRWTTRHRARILGALYTILLGNPQLKAPPEAPGKTRFKMWWRLVGSAVENAVAQTGGTLDFENLFIAQEDKNEEATSLAEALEILLRFWPGQFTAKEVSVWTAAGGTTPTEDAQALREFLAPGAPPSHVFSPQSIGMFLKKHLDAPVRADRCTLVLRTEPDKHLNTNVYHVEVLSVA